MMKEEKLFYEKPIIFIMMGLPGAGKTHSASKIADFLKIIHIEPDEFRVELFDEPDRSASQNSVVERISLIVIEKLMHRRQMLVYDNTNNRLSKRKQLYSLAKKHNFNTFLIWVQTDVDTAFVRASKRDKRKSDDKNAVRLDERRFERMIEEFQAPRQEECLVISGKHLFNTQIGLILKRLKELGLVGVPQKETLNVRPQLRASPDQQARRRLRLR